MAILLCVVCYSLLLGIRCDQVWSCFVVLCVAWCSLCVVCRLLLFVVLLVVVACVVCVVLCGVRRLLKLVAGCCLLSVVVECGVLDVA